MLPGNGGGVGDAGNQNDGGLGGSGGGGEGAETGLPLAASAPPALGRRCGGSVQEGHEAASGQQQQQQQPQQEEPQQAQQQTVQQEEEKVQQQQQQPQQRGQQQEEHQQHQQEQHPKPLQPLFHHHHQRQAVEGPVGDVTCPPDSVDGCELLSFHLPLTGNLGAVEVLPSAEDLRALLKHAVAVAAQLAALRPQVANLDKLARRIRSDLDFVRRCCCCVEDPSEGVEETGGGIGRTEPAGRGDDGGDRNGGGMSHGPPLSLSPVRVQGIINNLRGFQGELLAAQIAPDVIAVSRRFAAAVHLPPPPIATPKSVRVTEAATQSTTVQQPMTSPTVAATAAVVEAASMIDVPRGIGTSANVDGDMAGVAAAMVGQKRPLTEAVAEAVTGKEEETQGSGVGLLIEATAVAAAAAAGPVGVVGESSGGGGAGRKSGGGRVGKGGCGKGGGPPVMSVEVDVVSQNGHCWIEVKNQEVFGLESVHWTGSNRNGRGLRRQVEELVAVAAAPEHARRWTAPRVVVFFPSGVHPEVARELEARGVVVAGGTAALRSLPPPPPAPAITNLDVTAMCALVSQVSHLRGTGLEGEEGAEEWKGEESASGQEENGSEPQQTAVEAQVESWAQRTVHWKDCLAAERSCPMLPHLGPWLAPERPLIAAAAACRQFQLLMDMFAGPRERRLWELLQQRLQVVDTEAHPEELSPRCVAQLSDSLGPDQMAVFGLGEGRRALTLTANGNAVRSAERHGVALEVVLHRPVWLTGL